MAGIEAGLSRRESAAHPFLTVAALATRVPQDDADNQLTRIELADGDRRLAAREYPVV